MDGAEFFMRNWQSRSIKNNSHVYWTQRHNTMSTSPYTETDESSPHSTPKFSIHIRNVKIKGNILN
jgi:hypothetical protein